MRGLEGEESDFGTKIKKLFPRAAPERRERLKL